MACHACDCLHHIVAVPAHGKALCRQCGTLLYRPMPHSLDHATALYLAALVLLVIANSFPFMALQVGDRIEQSRLISAGLALLQLGMAEVGIVVLLTSVVFPGLTLVGMLYLLLSLRLGYAPPGKTWVWRMVQTLTPWSLIGVFMLGLLVSVVKLQDLAVIVPGVAFYAFVGLLVASSAALASFDPAVLWPRIGPVRAITKDDAGNSAATQGLMRCHTCHLLAHAPAGRGACPRCGSAFHGMRLSDSLTRSGALLTTAAFLLVPANLYPVMTVSRFGQGEPSTILSGVIHLIQDGAWPLGLLVLFASFVVPIGKIFALSFLIVSVRRSSTWRRRDRTLLYRLTEVVGAWSMVDIFLVAILVALVRIEGLATVMPGSGASFFGAAVIFTMLAAHAFDPRLIWDKTAPNDPAPARAEARA